MKSYHGSYRFLLLLNLTPLLLYILFSCKVPVLSSTTYCMYGTLQNVNVNFQRKLSVLYVCYIISKYYICINQKIVVCYTTSLQLNWFKHFLRRQNFLGNFCFYKDFFYKNLLIVFFGLSVLPALLSFYLSCLSVYLAGLSIELFVYLACLSILPVCLSCLYVGISCLSVHLTVCLSCLSVNLAFLTI